MKIQIILLYINEMDDEGRDEDNFRVSEQPTEKGKGAGGRRVGAGRKRVHDGGYKNVRDRLWKSLAVHTEVFEEWTRVREERGFQNNSTFATYLLNNIKRTQLSTNTLDTSQTSQCLTSERYVWVSHVISYMSFITVVMLLICSFNN